MQKAEIFSNELNDCELEIKLDIKKFVLPEV